MKDSRSMADQVQSFYWGSKHHRERRPPNHPVVRAVYEPLADMVAATVDDPKGASVLDVGCGNGFLQYALEHRFGLVVGMDYSWPMLEVNPCRHRLRAGSAKLPFRDKSFDVVASAHLFHHLTAPERIETLLEMNRVARQAVVSFEPNRNNPAMLAFALAKEAERMAVVFSPGYMKHLFRRAGFQDVRVSVRGWVVPNRAPVWWLPVAKLLDATPLSRLGVDICTIAVLKGSN